MGLDTTHNCWRGPYSQFMQWREWLAQQIGIPLLAMEHFADGDWKMTTAYLKAEYKPIPWAILTPDPLFVLLSHSDCDGEIDLDDLSELEVRLREVAASATDQAGPNPDMPRGCYDSMVKATIRFANGCKEAIKAGENIEFQ